MKSLAASFALIAFVAALLGFGMDVLALSSHLGKIAFVLAFSGFLLTVTAYLLDELLPTLNFYVNNRHI
jgi:hypothetical protein